MDFSPFLIISLIYAVIGVRVVVRLVRSWRETWDLRFTQRDRMLVDESAFFVLIPVSVALHELGHAVAIWLFGGRVHDFGFYGFAGYVSYNPFEFNDAEETLIAAAGSIVNLLLCLAALGMVFFWRPHFRAAINELLLQFAFLSGINAFIVYPLLDLASGLNGDWRQMYESRVSWLATAVLIVQAAVIVFGYWLLTNPRTKARMASLTDVPPGLERGAFGGLRQGKIDRTALNPAEAVLHAAAERVTSGWAEPVQTGIQRFNGGTAVTLQWTTGGVVRAIAARTFANGRTDLVGLNTRASPSPEETRPRLLHAWPSLPTTDDLTLGLRLAMETVDREG